MALLRLLFWSLIIAVSGVLGYLALSSSNSPVSDAWNPTRPLNINDPVTLLTQWKLENALRDPALCAAALATGANATALPDLEQSPQCFIRPQVSLSGVGQARLDPVNTRCQTALRLALWERHGIQPAAQKHLGTSVTRIRHFSSFSCRPIRTGQGASNRMSTHATADAIDISGFTLADGQQIALVTGWNGTPATAAFLRDVRDSACDWFRVTLSPDYNALHADHFHLQHTGWGLCR